MCVFFWCNETALSCDPTGGDGRLHMRVSYRRESFVMGNVNVNGNEMMEIVASDIIKH